MKRIVIIVLILIVIGIVAYRIASFRNTEEVQSISQIQKEKGVPVEVEKIIIANLERKINLTGTVEGIRQADALAGVMEKIIALEVRIGDYVEKGTIIAKLDTANPQARLAQADLALQDAARELKRMQNLYQTGAVSEQALEKTKLGYDIANANRDQAAELLTVKAPISGVVTDIFFFLGETPPPGAVVAKIANLEKMRIKINASYIFRGEVKRGQKAYLHEPSTPNKNIIGEVERVALTSDPENRTFQVYINVDNSDKYLQPGMSVEAEIVVERFDNILAAPLDAIVREADKRFVFVVKEGKVNKKEILTGITLETKVEVKSGLQAGEILVVNGQNNLSDGDKVLIVDGSQTIE